MGFFGTAWRVVQCVASLGGTERLRHYKELHAELVHEYNSIRARIDEANEALVSAVLSVRQRVRTARRTLSRAARLLQQLEPALASPDAAKTSSNALVAHPGSAADLARTHSASSGLEADAVTLAGVAAGTGAAAASWGIVQVIGHASTGAGITSLHGAAASSAGWAWFGGGSLASGGGGTAVGHLVLPGIGVAVAVAVSSVLSHTEANALSKACDEIARVNTSNERTLSVLGEHISGLHTLENRLVHEHNVLAHTVHAVHRSLLPWGILSHWWRLIRSWFTGSYFRREELHDVRRLQAAVERFLEAFT